MRITFTKVEIEALEKIPEALRLLACQHDVWDTEASAMDMDECCPVHDARRKELEEATDAIEKAY